MFFGELSLDGSIKAINGLPGARDCCKNLDSKQPSSHPHNRKEASYIEGYILFLPLTLQRYLHIYNQDTIIQPTKNHVYQSRVPEGMLDIKSVRGQNYAKRALEIAASGGHNIFWRGHQALENQWWLKHYSDCCHRCQSLKRLLKQPTFSRSLVIFLLLGYSKPDHSRLHLTCWTDWWWQYDQAWWNFIWHTGECYSWMNSQNFLARALRHCGSHHSKKAVKISRAIGNATYPARFILVAAANPCPCGNALSTTKLCHCSPMAKLRYQQRISGPILDQLICTLLYNQSKYLHW